MTRGGKREGAGRPSINKKSTKLTVYSDTRDCIKLLAAEFNLTGSELMERLVADLESFRNYLKKILNR